MLFTNDKVVISDFETKWNPKETVVVLFGKYESNDRTSIRMLSQLGEPIMRATINIENVFCAKMK